MRVSFVYFLGIVLKIFQMSGFYPFKVDLQLISRRQLNPNAIKIWGFILLLFSFAHVILSIIYEKQVFASIEDYVGKVSDILKYGATSICVIVVLIESLLRADAHRQLLRSIEGYRECILHAGVNYETYEKQFIAIYLLKFFFIFIGCAYVELTILFDFVTSPQWLNYWVVGVIPISICRMRNMQMVLYLDYLKLNMKLLVRELQHINFRSTRISGGKMDSEDLLRKLKFLKNSYGKLWMMSMEINGVFGLSQAFNFVQHFVSVTCSLYWFYSHACKWSLVYSIKCYIDVLH